MDGNGGMQNTEHRIRNSDNDQRPTADGLSGARLETRPTGRQRQTAGADGPKGVGVP